MSLVRTTMFYNDEIAKFEQFKAKIQEFCEDMGAHDLIFTDNELKQLSWLLNNSVHTPQAQMEIKGRELFEIKRALARRYSFELLIKGETDSYHNFIEDQAEPRLSQNDFDELSNEAKKLSLDEKTVIRLSCLLTMTDTAKNVVKEKNPSSDSEEFLSQLAVWLNTDSAIKQQFPIATDLTPTQLNLLTKMYWPNTHLRHMLQTEGGDNMTASLKAGIAKNEFTLEEDFAVYKWRWLTVSFGFDAGSGAKYHNAEIHALTKMVISELEQCFEKPDHSYLDGYLMQRAKLAGLDRPTFDFTLDEKAQYFLGHLAAFSNKVHVITFEMGSALLAGYVNYLYAQEDYVSVESASLPELYTQVRKNPNAITPTYVTSVFSVAYDVIYKREGDKLAADARTKALTESTQFICQVLTALYTLTLEMEAPRRISLFRMASAETVKRMLEEPSSQLTFKLNDKFEMEWSGPKSHTLTNKLR